MADSSYAEFDTLRASVDNNHDSFEEWEKLVHYAETLDGGINRNSAPQAIAIARDTYDRFLARFPLFFGYWKKYADIEFAVAGTEAAELIYERGVASIPNSVDFWVNYCNFKSDCYHDTDVVRELFERAAQHVGLDFHSHPFWDRYIEFEERLEEHDRVFGILVRVVPIPTHQYARYFERFRQAAQTRAPTDYVPVPLLAQMQAEVDMEVRSKGQSQQAADAEMRSRIDGYMHNVFTQTQTAVGKCWPFEEHIKRPYFHVTDLGPEEIANWHKYLDYEEQQGDVSRIGFLYERCIVATAQYEEFWLRYVRWMQSQQGKTQEVRHIFMRASYFFTPIARPSMRLLWALFEELQGRTVVAYGIYESILMQLGGHLKTIVAWSDAALRQEGVDAAIEVLRAQLSTSATDPPTKAHLYAKWARLLSTRSPEDARSVFKDNQQSYLDCFEFWDEFLRFETKHANTGEDEAAQHARVRDVFTDISKRSHLDRDSITALANVYMQYLSENGRAESVGEYLMVDREYHKSEVPGS